VVGKALGVSSNSPGSRKFFLGGLSPQVAVI